MEFVDFVFGGVINFLANADYIPYKLEHMLLLGLGLSTTGALLAYVTEGQREREYYAYHYNQQPPVTDYKKRPRKFAISAQRLRAV